MAAPGPADFHGYHEDEDNELISDDEERAKDRLERLQEEHRQREAQAEATQCVNDETEKKLKRKRFNKLKTFLKPPGKVLLDANPSGYDPKKIEDFKEYLLLNERPVDWRRAIEHLALNKRDISSLADAPDAPRAEQSNHLLNAVKDIKLWLYSSNLGREMLEELADYFQGMGQPAKRRRKTQYHQYTKPMF